MGLRPVLRARLVGCNRPDLPRRDDAQQCFDARRAGNTRAGARHARRSARRDRRGLVVVLDRPQERRQSARPTRRGAGESEGSRRLGRPRPFPRAHDRRRALRPGNAVRRQRNHGALQPSLPPLSPLVGRRRNPVVGLHVRVGLQGCDHALRLSARVSRDLLADHLRCAGSDLLRRPAEAERSEGRRADREIAEPAARSAPPDPTSKWIRTKHPTPASTIAPGSGSRPRLQAQEAPAPARVARSPLPGGGT